MNTEILEPTPENIQRAISTLAGGELVGMPTETVYGLAGNAFSIAAITRIFKAKERPTFDPLIVHVAAKPESERSILDYLSRLDLIQTQGLSPLLTEKLELLCQKFWPGPLTLVLPRNEQVPDLVTSGLNSVAIRIPSHPVAQALLVGAGPLAAPSANRFGHISPTRATDVKKELDGRVSLILDGGPCEIGVESTVLRVDAAGAVRLLRPGAISVTQLEEVFLTRIARASAGATAGKTSPAPSPGMSPSHYAPIKPFGLLPAAVNQLTPEQLKALASRLKPVKGTIGLLHFSVGVEKAIITLAQQIGHSILPISLCPTNTPEEAARNLFRRLRELDESEAVSLLSEPCPWPEGLGYAIADRLMRASA